MEQSVKNTLKVALKLILNIEECWIFFSGKILYIKYYEVSSMAATNQNTSYNQKK